MMVVIIWHVNNVNMNFVGYVEQNILIDIIHHIIYLDVLVCNLHIEIHLNFQIYIDF